jgi:hypothetical protein
MLPAGGTLANAVWSNHRYRYGSGKFTPDGDDQKLWYPGDGAPVNFAAYYPYSPTAATNNRVTYTFADQRDKLKKEAVDFCFHRGVTAYHNAHAEATHPSMQFYHKFSKIRMTVGGADAPDLSDLVVTLTKMPASATVDLVALTSNPGNLSALGVDTASTAITAWTTRTATSATVEAIVAPHSGAGNFTGRTVTFATGGGADVKTYAIPDNVTFEPGKVYGFTVTYEPGITPPLFPTSTVDGMTNCYMVKPNGKVVFRVSRAYTYNGSAFTNTLRVGGTHTGGFVAKVIWQDPGDLIESPTSTASAISGSGNTAIVTVKAKNNKSGNALVGIYKSTDTATPVWSYHIWVTSYAGDNPIEMVNGHRFMDRNLGATANDLSAAACGLLYQWGRKDPFPGSVTGSACWNITRSFTGLGDASPTSKTTNVEAIVDAIRKPTTFFRDVSVGDWLPALDNTLWRASGGEKTIYDPCPAGWRVPVHVNNSSGVENSPWMEYDDRHYNRYNVSRSWGRSSGGWTFTRNGISTRYPAAGKRLYDNGTARLGDSYGYYWSASLFKECAEILCFDIRSINSNDWDNRAYGFSVRCVRE